MDNEKLTVSCPVCGESKPEAFKIYFDGYVKLYQCRRCSFVAQYPGPGSSTIVEEYEDCYSLDFLEKGQEFMYPDRHRGLTDIAKRIRSVMQSNLKILDVGCGDGFFLFICKKLGFKCFGVEPSHVLANYALSKVKGKIIRAYYNEEIFQKDSFDVISFIQVVEHLRDPFSILNIAKYHLRPGGLLVIEVPSIHSPHFLAYRFTGIKKFVQPPHGVIYSHVGYYCPRSLTYLTDRCGFERLSLFTGRWRVKYSGVLRAISLVADPLMNASRIGGILYFGRKREINGTSSKNQ
jgi:SAM-dependent methyltransferase